MLEVREMRLVDAETLRREKDKTVALLEKRDAWRNRSTDQE